MKLLVTGARGQLGAELVEFGSANGLTVRGIDRDELDFLELDRVAEVIADERADWVINCAAYTQVDRAEAAEEAAFRVNRDAARAVARGVRHYSGRMVQLSTDFVFDGKSSVPYEESAECNPLSVYGRSKWAGEIAVREELPDALVLRTAWVYGNHGQNFVKTMLRLAGEREELRVVDDQIGSPSWTFDIAQTIVALIEADAQGVYHFTNEGVASWYDLAESTLELARKIGYPIKPCRVVPIPSADYPTPAARPHYSVLSKRKTRALLGNTIPHWRKSLRNMLELGQLK